MRDRRELRIGRLAEHESDVLQLLAGEAPLQRSSIPFWMSLA
jgi:hypothetical protein